MNTRKTRTLLIRLTLVGTLVMSGWASAAGHGLEDRVIMHRLSNGLTILMVERHQAPIVSINMTFGVGGVNEQTGKTGVAHLYEHMAFKGTRTLGTLDYERERPLLKRLEGAAGRIRELRAELREARYERDLLKGAGSSSVRVTTLERELTEAERIFQELQEAASALVVNNEMAELYQRHGGVGLNASTSKDVTRYMVSLPANRLPLWAAIESDRMANPVLREFYKERAVVMEERRLRTEDNPHGLLYEAFTALAFQAHPYQFPTIGWASDIMALTPEDTREFFHTYYGPDNTVVAIVGDINPKEVIALMEREFGAIPRNGSRPRVATVEPPQRGERRVEVEFDAEPAVLIGYHKPGLDHPDDFVFDVIDSILSEGVTSRLYQRLVREKRVAASVNTFSGYPGAKDPSLFVITAVPLAPHTTQEVEAAIYEELDRLKTEPVSRKELEKVLNTLDADLVRSLRSNSGLASQLAYFQSVAGDWRYILRARERIGAVTPEDIQRVTSAHFVKANRTVATLTKPTATPAPQLGTPPPSTMPLGRPAEQSAQEGQEGEGRRS